ncbi:DinB family protein [Pontibacter sp. BAB1700]|uniref:DinB family protein n=1 Tax=Pontibacter sp. BAB1700 TaxID=1144253 RepID=UPI00026BC5E2|nr:DinB family protein [Pontibacter sp. BAB1700]EJF08679.1 dinb family protein [Pontibacter sp. BAB1700]
MEISSIPSFLDYYGKIRQRTERVIACIPADQFDWTYREGKFTFADQIRHIAAIERYLYAETVQGRSAAYTGCGKALADDPEQVLAFFREKHQESLAIFSSLSDQGLQQKIQTPGGGQITCWKWLRALIEHEIHHRAHIYTYLGILGIPTPPIFGLTSEQVQEQSTQASKI